MNTPTVAVIIPAYNEEKTVANVVRVARTCSLVRDVIVVSDGSVDRTAEVSTQAGAISYQPKLNLGKGGAMLLGVEKTDAEIILFLDADLIGLTEEHIEQLLRPVIDNIDTMHVGVIDRGSIFTPMMHWLPLISGQRAMRRVVIDNAPRRFLKGFMVEPALNYVCKTRGLRIGVSDLRGLTIRRKFEKVSVAKAVIQYLRMSLQIFWALVVVRVARLFKKF